MSDLPTPSEAILRRRLIEGCRALGEVMAGIDGVPESTARQIAWWVDEVATADTSDRAVTLAADLAGLSAGVVGHRTLDAPDTFDDLLRQLRDDREALQGPAGRTGTAVQTPRDEPGLG